MRIRPATTADAHQVEAVARAAYAAYVPRMGVEPAPMGADHAAAIAEGAVAVAAEGEDVLGYVVLRVDGRTALLENVGVRPDQHGRGIGRSLIDHAERAALALGYDRITLYTNEAMTGNLALYPRLGYTEVRRVVEDGYRRVYFEKPLGGSGRR